MGSIQSGQRRVAGSTQDPAIIGEGAHDDTDTGKRPDATVTAEHIRGAHCITNVAKEALFAAGQNGLPPQSSGTVHATPGSVGIGRTGCNKPSGMQVASGERVVNNGPVAFADGGCIVSGAQQRVGDRAVQPGPDDGVRCVSYRRELSEVPQQPFGGRVGRSHYRKGRTVVIKPINDGLFDDGQASNK